MQWGHLVDFLAPEKSSEVLRSLVGAAIDEFRALGVAAVSCYATDPAARAAHCSGAAFFRFFDGSQFAWCV